MEIENENVVTPHMVDKEENFKEARGVELNGKWCLDIIARGLKGFMRKL